jgi:hypothetical protein
MTVSPIMASIVDDIDPKRTIRIAIDDGALVPTTGVVTVTAVVDGQLVTVQGTYTIAGKELTVEVSLDGTDIEIVAVNLDE